MSDCSLTHIRSETKKKTSLWCAEIIGSRIPLEVYGTSFKSFEKCFHYRWAHWRSLRCWIRGDGVHGAVIKARWKKWADIHQDRGGKADAELSAPNWRPNSSSPVVFLAFPPSEVCFVMGFFFLAQSHTSTFNPHYWLYKYNFQSYYVIKCMFCCWKLERARCVWRHCLPLM